MQLHVTLLLLLCCYIANFKKPWQGVSEADTCHLARTCETYIPDYLLFLANFVKRGVGDILICLFFDEALRNVARIHKRCRVICGTGKLNYLHIPRSCLCLVFTKPHCTRQIFYYSRKRLDPSCS